MDYSSLGPGNQYMAHRNWKHVRSARRGRSLLVVKARAKNLPRIVYFCELCKSIPELARMQKYTAQV